MGGSAGDQNRRRSICHLVYGIEIIALHHLVVKFMWNVQPILTNLNVQTMEFNPIGISIHSLDNEFVCKRVCRKNRFNGR